MTEKEEHQDEEKGHNGWSTLGGRRVKHADSTRKYEDRAAARLKCSIYSPQCSDVFTEGVCTRHAT